MTSFVFVVVSVFCYRLQKPSTSPLNLGLLGGRTYNFKPKLSIAFLKSPWNSLPLSTCTLIAKYHTSVSSNPSVYKVVSPLFKRRRDATAVVRMRLSH